MTAAPFGRSQRLYDAVYSWKDYAAEAERLQPHLRGTSILDVACGTGGHIPHLRGAYEVVGVDIDPGMLDIAHEKNPGAEFHAGDMTLLELEGDSTVLTMHYLVGSEGRIDHLQEVHRLRLFSDEEYRGAFERAGLAVELDADGPMGRGLYIGARR